MWRQRLHGSWQEVLVKVTCRSRVTHFYCLLSHQMWCFLRWATTAELYFYLSGVFFFPKQWIQQTHTAGKERKMKLLCCGEKHWHIPSSVNSSFNPIFPFFSLKFMWKDSSVWKIWVPWLCLCRPSPHVPLNLECRVCIAHQCTDPTAHLSLGQTPHYLHLPRLLTVKDP